MKKLIAACLLAVSVPTMAQVSQETITLKCQSTTSLVSDLVIKYGETARWFGFDEATKLGFVLFGNNDTKSWTFVAVPSDKSGMSCVVSMGTNFKFKEDELNSGRRL